MINNIQIKDLIISELGVEGRADLIKSALEKAANSEVVERDYEERTLKSEDRFQKAKEKFEEEQRIFNASPTDNAKIVLEKHIKSISTKLEALGF
jgi:hypothetical protein